MYIKRLIQSGEKYLDVCGWKIKYRTEGADDNKRIFVGPFKFTYHRLNEEGSVYIKVFCFKFNLDRVVPNRKLRHYRKRKQLSDSYCKKILQQELAEGLGYVPNIDHPQTYNEKILWLKFNDHNPLITTCCDKFAVKDYVAKTIGKEYIVPTLKVYDAPDKINFDELPDQFALKVNWGSGYNFIVKDKNNIDENEIRRQIKKWISPESNSYYDTFNWGYKNMKPVIYAEKYIEQIDGQVYDYKFYICNGKFEFLFIATDRLQGHLTYNFFDKDFNFIPFTYGNKPNANPLPEKPINYEKMISLAEKLAKPFPFVRVDFYEMNKDEFYVGEMTFYSGGGTLGIKPVEWDYKLGEKIQLNY